MTVAELSVRHAESMERLRGQILTILTSADGPLGHGAIEAHLQKMRVEGGGPLDALNKYDVRDVISELVDEGQATYTLGGKVVKTRK